MSSLKKLMVIAVPLAIVAGCSNLGADDRSLLEQANMKADQASAAADQATAAANRAAQAAQQAANAAQQAAREAKTAGDKADRIFQKSLRK